MKKVLVLLSTYNGDKYLEQQLQSLQKQKNVNIHIYIRDDGSKDNTLNILENYSKCYPNLTVFAESNLGFVGSFTELVHKAFHSEKYDYYAFCDQDDIWFDNKLIFSINALELKDDNKPLMFCSNSDIIDSEGNLTGKKFVKSSNKINKHNVLLYSFTQGCSMVFNYKALELFHKFPPVGTYHDRWLTLICATFGQIVYSDKALFGYRIHSNNALGIKVESPMSFIEHIRRRIKYWSTSSLNIHNLRYSECCAFIKKFRNSEKEEDLYEVRLVANARNSFYSRCKLAVNIKFLPGEISIKACIKHFTHVILNKL